MSTDRLFDISQRAYAIWEQAGCPAGTALDDWLQAEAEFSKALAVAAEFSKALVVEKEHMKSCPPPKAPSKRKPKRKR